MCSTSVINDRPNHLLINLLSKYPLIAYTVLATASVLRTQG